MHKRLPLALGLNCAHDAAACIAGEQGILVAIREERLSRVKHHEGFPHRAIRYCLDAMKLDSIDALCAATINQYPKMDCEFALRDLGFTGTIYVNPSHHLLHAVYARHCDGMEDGLVVVVDGSGYSYGEYRRNGSPMLGPDPADDDADEAESVFMVCGGELKLVHKRWGIWESSTPYFRFPSLGHVYSVASQHIFGEVRGWIYAGKVMGLAPYGRLDSTIPRAVDEARRFDLGWAYRLPKLEHCEEYWADPARQDIAARVQDDLESALTAWFRNLSSTHRSPKVCLTGGVAHNSVANGKLARDGAFPIFGVTPAADDGGTALGGALYALERAQGFRPKIPYRGDFHGVRYPATEVLEQFGSDPRVRIGPFEDSSAMALDAAEQLAKGRFIAVFDGPSEFSARALGHRSILCDARGGRTKAHLNEYVKFREPFRPYAAMVLQEYVGDYFDPPITSPYMMVVVDIRAEKREAIPAVCHIDGTCRIQTIGADYDGVAAEILRAFHACTGMPLVLNTSLNVRGEPIVETLSEAVDCFLSTGLDVLYAPPYRIEKHPVSWDADDPVFRGYAPAVSGGLTVERSAPSHDGRWAAPRFGLRSRTGHVRPLTSESYALLIAVDGHRTVGELLHLDPNALAILRALHREGALCFARQV